jgi:hypothetical protein
MTKPKDEIISFKVDKTLARVLRAIPNRSKFLRKAVATALKNTCPLCRGIGTLTPEQLEHWTVFSERHFVQECEDCQAAYIVCGNEDKKREVHSP